MPHIVDDDVAVALCNTVQRKMKADTNILSNCIILIGKNVVFKNVEHSSKALCYLPTYFIEPTFRVMKIFKVTHLTIVKVIPIVDYPMFGILLWKFHSH